MEGFITKDITITYPLHIQYDAASNMHSSDPTPAPDPTVSPTPSIITSDMFYYFIKSLKVFDIFL